MTVESWQVLQREREAFERFMSGEFAPLDREFEQVSEGPQNYRADQQLAALRPRLDALYARRDAWLRRIAILEEREPIIADLIRRLGEETVALHVQLDAIMARADVPDAATMRAFYDKNRAAERLRLSVFDATGDARFAREQDFVETLRVFWREQGEARSRMFSHVLAPGNRPKNEPPPWHPLVMRLRELQVVKEETSHV